MKIAICISGFLRTWEYNKDSFVNVFCKGLDMSNVDIFIHTYYQNFHEATAGLEDITYTKDEILAMFANLPLKDFIIENRTKEWLRDKIVGPSVEKYKDVPNFMYDFAESSDGGAQKIPLGSRIYDQLRVMESANNIRREHEKSNKVKYDLVVKTRFDVFYHSTPNWIYSELGNGEIHTELGTTGGYPRDCVCISTPEVMDNTYASRFSNLDKIYSPDNSERVSCAHYTLRFMAQMTNTPIRESCCIASVSRAPGIFHLPYFGNKNLNDTLQTLHGRYNF